MPAKKWFRGRDRAVVKKCLEKLRQLQARDGRVSLAPNIESSKSVAVLYAFDKPTLPAAVAQVVNRLEEVLELTI